MFASDEHDLYAETQSLLRELVSDQVWQIKMAELVDKFGEIIGDRTPKHIKSLANICCWVRLRSLRQILEDDC